MKILFVASIEKNVHYSSIDETQNDVTAGSGLPKLMVSQSSSLSPALSTVILEIKAPLPVQHPKHHCLAAVFPINRFDQS